MKILKNALLFLFAFSPQLIWAAESASLGGSVGHAFKYAFYLVFFIGMFIVLPIFLIYTLYKSIRGYLEKNHFKPPKNSNTTGW